MATDNFNRADGAVGANWTGLQNGHAILSNQVKGNTVGYCFSIWNADAFNADHYSQAIVNTQGAYNGLLVRGATGVDGYIWWMLIGATGSIYRVDDGGYTELQSGVPAPANGSVCKMTAEGSAIKLYDDGAQVGTTATDSTYATGAAGLFQYGDAGTLMDDWEGGNLGAAASILRQMLVHHG